MPDIDVALLRAEMEAEREWRERELRLLRNQFASLSEEQRSIARKALIVMLYAHFEGATKALLSMYVTRVNALGLRVGDVISALGAAALADLFRALRDPNAKCREFARALPEDGALHRFARDREFLEAAEMFAARAVQLDVDDVVDTESNLKPIVLRKILFRLGLNPELAAPWEGVMHQLLSRRNDVAHGTARGGIAERDYSKLEQAVALVLDGLMLAISDAATTNAFRATGAG